MCSTGSSADGAKSFCRNFLKKSSNFWQEKITLKEKQFFDFFLSLLKRENQFSISFESFIGCQQKNANYASVEVLCDVIVSFLPLFGENCKVLSGTYNQGNTGCTMMSCCMVIHQ